MYPLVDEVSVTLSPGDITCSDVRIEDTTCTVSITADGDYTVTLSIRNAVGSTMASYKFDCE